MKLLAFITAFTFLSYAAIAQQVNDPVFASLSPSQKTISRNIQKFYDANNLKFSTTAVMKQLNQLLPKYCQSSCPVNSPLPVRGLELKGERKSETSVKLDWFTLAEINNDGFVIERQFEFATSFDSVGFVKGVGNTFGKTRYSSNDANSNSSRTFYRLKQVDIDGRITYSNTIVVEGYLLPAALKVTPNPATSGNINIQLTGFRSNKKLRLVVLDSKGSIVYNKDNVMPGQAWYQLNQLQLLSGVYYVKVYNEYEGSQTTFVVK